MRRIGNGYYECVLTKHASVCVCPLYLMYFIFTVAEPLFYCFLLCRSGGSVDCTCDRILQRTQ